MADLPERFLASVREILGEEYEAFLSEFDDRRHYGLRVNTSKISKEEFERIAPFHLTPIPWVKDAYFYEKEDNPARHPFYAAGLYYLQEPSAMTPASRLEVLPGDKVLDLCAAPGGKATALAAHLQGQGILVANDINTARARALLRNLELFGIPNSFVTNEPPHVLAEKFPEFFDKIMVDAPCSGEGMFRKNPMVVEAWLEKGPEYFSTLQKEIVLHAADMLKPGGSMFYSTCTFSPLENESTITWLLEQRPEMQVIPMEEYQGFSEGLTSFGEMTFHPDCRLTRRIWPHHMSGEGHYLALLRKKDDRNVIIEDKAFPDGNADEKRYQDDMIGCKECADTERKADLCMSSGETEKRSRKKEEKARRKAEKKARYAMSSGSSASTKSKKTGRGMDRRALGSKEQREILDEFLSLLRGPMAERINQEHLEIRSDKVYYVPQKGFEELGIHFLRNGIYLGDLKKNRFEPSQPCALALSGDSFAHCLNFSQEDERLQAYMHGETLQVEDIIEDRKKQGQDISNGWYLLLVERYPLGFGKLAGSILKNKYPTGWRQ